MEKRITFTSHSLLEMQEYLHFFGTFQRYYDQIINNISSDSQKMY